MHVVPDFARSFWVGDEPVQGPLGTVLRGPMYVAWEGPRAPRHTRQHLATVPPASTISARRSPEA